MTTPFFTGQGFAPTRFAQTGLVNEFNKEAEQRARVQQLTDQTISGLGQAFQQHAERKQKKEQEDAAVQFLKQTGAFGGDEKMLRSGVKSVGTEKVFGLAQIMAQQAQEQSAINRNKAAIASSFENVSGEPTFNPDKFLTHAREANVPLKLQQQTLDLFSSASKQQQEEDFQPSFQELETPSGEKRTAFINSRGSAQLLPLPQPFKPTATVQEIRDLERALLEGDTVVAIPLFKKLVASDAENMAGLEDQGGFTLELMRRRLGIDPSVIRPSVDPNTPRGENVNPVVTPGTPRGANVPLGGGSTSDLLEGLSFD